MIRVERSVEIDMPVEKVYAYVTNGDNATQRQGGVAALIADGPQDVMGAQSTEVRKLMGQEMKSVMEITVIEANSRWAARALKGPAPYEVTVTFEPSGGGTRMTTHVEGEPTGFFKLAEGAIRGQLEKSLEEDGKRLKGILESG
jgi:uncharacterized protein YndB with AHSA1/START domain